MGTKQAVEMLKKHKYKKQRLKCCATCNNVSRSDGDFGHILHCAHPETEREGIWCQPQPTVLNCGVCDMWEQTVNGWDKPIDV